jgi:2-(3-amino-3-carboxypropyl)histidine synthase
MTTQEPIEPIAEPKDKPRRRIVRRRRPAEEKPVIEPAVLEAILRQSSLPAAYSFEVTKTLERIKKVNATHVALQMPEGLLMYATVIADILKQCCSSLNQVSVLGDVTYGACCVDDLGARALGAQLLVHYGHSCLVPIQHTVISTLYVFVELQIDVAHLVECVVATIDNPQPLSLLGTIQFRQALVEAKPLLEERGFSVAIPQAKPLSPGEVLGCTSPYVDTPVVVFCADGRFHLESCMISNPTCQFLRYDPYGKTLTEEVYKHDQLHSLRKHAIEQAHAKKTFGIVLGTLGRQGNPAIARRIQLLLSQHGKKSFILLLSEVSPAKLSLFAHVDAWVQIACPRLSVDWGHLFGDDIPILSPYELFVCFDNNTSYQEPYPMDFYSNQGGPWSNYYKENKERQFSCD